MVSHFSASVGQAKALSHIQGALIDFIDDRAPRSDKIPTCPPDEWKSKSKTMGLSCKGDVVHTPLLLKIDEVLPGLPPPGYGAMVRAVDLYEGHVRDCL